MNKPEIKPEISKIEADKSANKRAYVTPEIQSEKLNSYGAVCNGTTVSGRKASTATPAFCNSAKINS